MIPVQIVVGRNTIDGYPLSAAAWGKFQAAIAYTLSVGGDFYRLIPGTGVDMKGGAEENATLLGQWDETKKLDLEDFLHGLRVKYEQAAILLIWGELEVIA